MVFKKSVNWLVTHLLTDKVIHRKKKLTPLLFFAKLSPDPPPLRRVLYMLPNSLKSINRPIGHRIECRYSSQLSLPVPMGMSGLVFTSLFITSTLGCM